LKSELRSCRRISLAIRATPSGREILSISGCLAALRPDVGFFPVLWPSMIQTGERELLRSSFMTNKPPELPVKVHQTLSLEDLLCRTDQMFPLLPKAFSVDHSVYGIVAKVRMDPLDLRMKVNSS
jgi:hypothetical protein